MKLEKQIAFLNSIDQVRRSPMSYVNELAELLEISNDSAYRRLRGETSLTFDEISKLCKHYGISFDSFNADEQSRVVSFHYQKMVGSYDNFNNYFADLSESMDKVRESRAEEKQIIYAGQGMPIFHYFKFPALSAFKVFHWLTTGVSNGNGSERFDPGKVDPGIMEIGKKLFNSYLQIPSTEIWSDTIVMGTIHQIQFYWDSGMFANADVALQVCNEFRLLLEYVQDMCMLGKKQDDFENPTIRGSKLRLYYCEIELEKVCVLVKMDDFQRIYLGQLTFGSMYTENKEYYNETEEWLNSIIKKSNLISEVSQTIRHQFFKRGLKNLNKLEERIKAES